MAEKLKIAFNDGTSTIIPIEIPSAPGTYKAHATLSDGTTLNSGTFVRAADSASKTLKLKFGFNDGTSQTVSFTLPAIVGKNPTVSAICEAVDLSNPILGYELYGTVENKNIYPVMCELSYKLDGGVPGETVSRNIAAQGTLTIDHIFERLENDDVELNVSFLSPDGTVDVGTNVICTFGNYTDTSTTTTVI